LISATDSDAIRKVADFDRNHWPICFRIGGRFTPDSVADLNRITHTPRWQYLTLDHFSEMASFSAYFVLTAHYEQKNKINHP
jgi:hypothetical protein